MAGAVKVLVKRTFKEITNWTYNVIYIYIQLPGTLLSKQGNRQWTFHVCWERCWQMTPYTWNPCVESWRAQNNSCNDVTAMTCWESKVWSFDDKSMGQLVLKNSCGAGLNQTHAKFEAANHRWRTTLTAMIGFEQGSKKHFIFSTLSS